MAIKAKRGDCLAVVTTTTDFYIGQPNVTREHYWPGHEGGLPMPFESLAELRDALRPFRVAVIA